MNKSIMPVLKVAIIPLVFLGIIIALVIFRDTYLGTPINGQPLPVSPSPQLSVTAGDPVLVGAGDIASCESEGDEATANLLDQIKGTVFTTGDNVYPDGSPAEFSTCYESSWGRHKAWTRPVPGNHDYHTKDGSGYFAYFGVRAGESGRGYYSYNLGEWHILALNSNCSQIGGCGSVSPQMQWLRNDLITHPTQCTLAYWHHPRFSSGEAHGSNSALQAIWETIYEFNVDIVINGHEHNYERFTPQDPNGNPDLTHGIRQFVVGTGGKNLYDFGPPLPTSEVRYNTSYGVLKLTLQPDSYAWQFITTNGGTFDTGRDTCRI